MKSVRFPQDLSKAERWLKQARGTAFSDGKEDKRWMEYWCLVEVYKRAAALCHHAPEFTVEHTNLADGAPDFHIEWGGIRTALEVTEATTPEDRYAIRRAREVDGSRMLGEPFLVAGKTIPGGRFRGGSSSNEWERALAGDVCDAIVRKSGKSYACDGWLIVYPNSNATMAEPSEAYTILCDALPSHPFSQVDILWPGGGLVRICGNHVRYFAE